MSHRNRPFLLPVGFLLPAAGLFLAVSLAAAETAQAVFTRLKVVFKDSLGNEITGGIKVVKGGSETIPTELLPVSAVGKYSPVLVSSNPALIGVSGSVPGNVVIAGHDIAVGNVTARYNGEIGYLDVQVVEAKVELTIVPDAIL